MDQLELAVIGGGAAGYFGALRATSLCPKARVVIFEAGQRPLVKVGISGGGRCNVTHECFDPQEFSKKYPRGSKELRGAFHRFQAADTVEWFRSRGVELKAEEDGRMFPITDDSKTIIDCLEQERVSLGVELRLATKIELIEKTPEGFELTQRGQAEKIHAKALLLATGSGRKGYEFAEKLRHQISPLAPSLFTFEVPDSEIHSRAGISAPDVEVALFLNDQSVTVQRGPILFTHWGLSGPVILRTSAWAARELSAVDYTGLIQVNWLPALSEQNLREALAAMRESSPRKSIENINPFGLPSRLWEYLVLKALPRERTTPWGQLSRTGLESLLKELRKAQIPFSGKGQFKEEFVTCGGVVLSEIDFRSMESKLVKNLYFAGELLDVDGITGGFNFQNAWTTGWIAGTSIGEKLGAK